MVGASTQYRTTQDHLKVKLAYDLPATVRATYTFGWWDNRSQGRSMSFLRDATGNPVTAGPIRIDGAGFAPLTGADLPATDESLTHVMHGLSVKSRTQGVFDWEASASRYDYRRDRKRQNGAGNTLPAALEGGPGSIADGSGTGWSTLALRGTWRPQGPKGAHVVDVGVQEDRFALDYTTSAIAGNWRSRRPRRAGQRCRRAHAPAQRVGAGHLGLRARLEDGARSQARALVGVLRLHGDPGRRAAGRRIAGRRAARRTCRPRRRSPGSGSPMSC